MAHFAQDDLMCRFDEKNGTQGAFFMVFKFRWRSLEVRSRSTVRALEREATETGETRL